MDTVGNEVCEARVRRRRHSNEFKASVIAQCMRPGVSIARIALEHGLNANLLRRWVADAERGAGSGGALAVGAALLQGVAPVGHQFVSVPIETGSPAMAPIELELHRGPLRVKVKWPAGAATECGTWLRELLR